jgi:hydrogenase nickel incorporation protein HypA/HybF
MHELQITQSILEISLRYAEQARAKKIIEIRIAMGQLSSFVDDAIQIYWDIMSECTIAVGAKLHFRRISAVIRCHDCQQSYQSQTSTFTCPNCGGFWGEIIAGDEFYVESIDVIEEEEYDKESNLNNRKYPERQ